MNINIIINNIRAIKGKNKYFLLIYNTAFGIENLSFSVTHENYNEIITKLNGKFNMDGVCKEDKNIKIIGFSTCNNIEELLNYTIDTKFVTTEKDLVPYDVWINKRISEVTTVIQSYIQEGKRIPINLTNELAKLNNLLDSLNN